MMWNLMFLVARFINIRNVSRVYLWNSLTCEKAEILVDILFSQRNAATLF